MTTGTGPQDALAGAFEEQRGRLVAVAHRMLGSRADAEDAVQEAWLRLARQDPAGIDNLGGWLTTVVGRVCLDVLRARRIRPEAPYDDRLPELVVSQDEEGAPEDGALLAESVGLALLVVLDTLRPTERLAFVLHDMFAVPFEDIGRILGRSPDAAKMLASRARRKVQGGSPRPAAERQRQRAVVDAFLAAARAGDFEGLMRVLDPDVTWRSFSGRGEVVRVGAAEVAVRAQRGARAAVTTRSALIDGEPGIVVWGPSGRVMGVMACTVADGRIVEVLSVSDPERLAAMDLPAHPGPDPSGH
ncbi:RNA polymerase sigma-70 factor, ECF subfamily [Actinacidiphila yanglinensis]|uniref:RNA polymerase sigma-70 factor, ECF subfamily n=1 Tax=Actinacidiphila yanglinensis TaxID=310779 RepID=A0A1H6DNA2_9ACTN|nr:sigma-70 family RNA polymerase sigma factor [Actinacidiphila yanglinensis]SEG86651.1 RNA polymerase sigma-70 factor, ECF subfamily [Actinacidiphila yanglinensis]